VKYLIIVNPTSGRGFAGKMIPRIESLLQAQQLDFEIVQTERPWHAAEIAENASRQGYDVIAVASGDGTANEAINGLMGARKAGFNHTAVSMLPVGTGNDAAYGLGFSQDLEKAVEALARNQRHRVDVGLVCGGDYPDGRYFINGVGIGFDAAVGFTAAKIRWARGLLAYLIAALETIFLYYKPPTVELTMNGKTTTLPALMVSIMNGRRLGGGFYTAPEGDDTDGLFDVCIASVARRMRILQLIPYFLKGTQASQPEIRMERTDRIIVRAVKGVLPAHADGETLCYEGQELSMELVPGALEFIRTAE
jgi:YegS/Rv2252/BmrU family lipid kinase